MKIILWVLLALFLIGNAFFILPYHYSEDKVTSSYYINYKKDSALLRNVFPDTAIQLKLNMPPGYEILYRKDSNAVKKKYNPFHLFVNVCEVKLDRLFCYKKLACYFLVGQAFCHKFSHLGFPI